MNANEGWVAGEGKIFHTTDGGNTWQLEWESQDEIWISYIGYDVAAGVIWAGGSGGILLKRPVVPTASIAPRRNLLSPWGKIKIGTP